MDPIIFFFVSRSYTAEFHSLCPVGRGFYHEEGMTEYGLAVHRGITAWFTFSFFFLKTMANITVWSHLCGTEVQWNQVSDPIHSLLTFRFCSLL